MFIPKCRLIAAAIVVVAAGLIGSGSPGGAQQAAPGGQEPAKTASSAPQFKILYVTSYHMDWEWPADQLKGFQDALKGVNVEYKVFEMDTKRKSDEEWKQKVSKEACETIDSWKPSLVFTSDDNAQKYVTVKYLESPIPFVFCAVNSTPETYGFDKAKNVAGVLEQEHIVQTIRLLEEIVPTAKKIAILTDPDSTWPGVIDRMKKYEAEHPGEIEIVSADTLSTFAEYKQKVAESVGKADAIALLGIFNFKDEKGVNVHWEEVARWTAENSTLPEISFWKDRVYWGALCSVTISGYEQGLAAGKLARAILVGGKAPTDFKFEPTVKGLPVVNLARARKLGIKIKSDILLSAEVVEKFEWEAKK